MKKFVFFAAVLAGSAVAFSQELIEEFLAARFAENPVRYERAAKAMVAEAAEGKPLHQFLLAAVSDEQSYPVTQRISAELQAEYLKTNRRRIAAIAEQKDNPLALYILFLENDNISYLKKAAEGDCVYALNELAMRMMDDARKRNFAAGTSDILRKAFWYFSRAAEKNDASGYFNRGKCYMNGHGCKASNAEAFSDLSRASELNHPGAKNLLGEMYRDGISVEKNLQTAEEYFAASAKTGNPYGCYNHAMMILSSKAQNSDPSEAVKLLEKAAKARYPQAMDEYGKCLYNSIGIDASVTNNHHQAVVWWYNAATEEKYAPAMVSLAKAFLEGKGVEKNELVAISWFEKAAYEGLPAAMVALAECHEKGRGNFTPSRYNANWWRTCARAAEGDRNAKVWLGSHNLK